LFLYIFAKKIGMKSNNDTLVILQYRRIYSMDPR
jgi:hypothetical protein